MEKKAYFDYIKEIIQQQEERMKLYPVILITVLAAFTFSAAQTVSFTKAPVKFQLYPRDGADSGTAVISGTVIGAGYDSIVVDVKKGAAAYKHIKAVLTYGIGSAPFSISVRLLSDLSEYKFDIYGNTTRVGGADSVVCGDVLAMTGQSNMEAGGTGAYDWRISEWVRSTAYSGSNAVWARGSEVCCFGNWPNYNTGGNAPAGVGQVGAALAGAIATAYQTPVCIINGAYSGTVIEQHQPNPANHADTTTLYGRLLRRAQVAGVVNDIKAFLYNQGEYYNDTINYARLYDSLRKAWKGDYPNLQKIYEIQVNTGCGYAFNPQIREIQRKFSETYNDVTVMSVVGVCEYTGCHYGSNGYAQMGQWVARVYERDFFGATTANITSPRILSASYTSVAHTALELNFDMPVIWPADTLGYAMKDYVTLDATYGNIDSVRVIGNVLRLYLHAASSATKVSYIPLSTYRGTSTTYTGPYIRSALGVGALTFLNYPITAGNLVEADRRLSAEKSLLAASPNPFVASTRITLPFLRADARMLLKVYAPSGRMVADLSAKAGMGNSVEWNTAGLPSGVYLVRYSSAGRLWETRAVLAR
jgi:hypothetical protein